MTEHEELFHKRMSQIISKELYRINEENKMTENEETAKKIQELESGIKELKAEIQEEDSERINRLEAGVKALKVEIETLNNGGSEENFVQTNS